MCGPLLCLSLVCLAAGRFVGQAVVFYLSGENKKFAISGAAVPPEGPRERWQYMPIYKLRLASDVDHFAALHDMTKELKDDN